MVSICSTLGVPGTLGERFAALTAGFSKVQQKHPQCTFVFSENPINRICQQTLCKVFLAWNLVLGVDDLVSLVRGRLTDLSSISVVRCPEGPGSSTGHRMNEGSSQERPNSILVAGGFG